MAEALIDIKIFPNKEMSSVDMAEMLDATIPNNSIIQGCELTLVNGVFNISSGRLVVGGRLGVVTGGTIPNPTSLTATTICYPLAVCDLSDSERPFYFLIATPDDLNRLNLNTEERNPTFNINNGTDALVFGYCSVNPATGLASDYHALSGATAKKGWDWWGALYNRVEKLESHVNWSTVNADGFRGLTWATIPAGASEAFVEVYVAWDTQQKVSVDFYLPFNNWIYSTSAASKVHANHWGSSWDGVVSIETRIVNGSSYQVRLLHSYKGTKNEAADTSWRVFYR